MQSALLFQLTDYNGAIHAIYLKNEKEIGTTYLFSLVRQGGIDRLLTSFAGYVLGSLRLAFGPLATRKSAGLSCLTLVPKGSIPVIKQKTI